MLLEIDDLHPIYMVIAFLDDEINSITFHSSQKRALAYCYKFSKDFEGHEIEYSVHEYRDLHIDKF